MMRSFAVRQARISKAIAFNKARSEHHAQMSISGKMRGNMFAGFLWLSNCRTDGYKINYLQAAKNRLN